VVRLLVAHSLRRWGILYTLWQSSIAMILAVPVMAPHDGHDLVLRFIALHRADGPATCAQSRISARSIGYLLSTQMSRGSPSVSSALSDRAAARCPQ
jgi:hypothetical protein